MSWEYTVTGCILCTVCGGHGGWEMKDGVHTCRRCQGTGEETREISLDEALRDSELIKDMLTAIEDLLNR